MTYPTITHNPTAGLTAPSSWGDDVNAAVAHLNTAFHVELFPRSSGMVDSNTAGMLYSSGSGAAGTPVVEFPILQANGSSLSARKWIASCPPGYGAALYLHGQYYMPVLGSGAFVLGVRVSAFATGGTITSEAFAAQTLGTVTANPTANVLTAFTLTPAALDSLVAGIPLSIEFERLPANAGDTEGGTVSFTKLDAYFTLSA
jgi:hypothetical protein